MQGNGHRIEWGTPVLYMRAGNGQLFRPAANPDLYPDEHGTPKETPVPMAATLPRQAAPPIAPTVQAEESTVPLPPEAKPAERQVPPAKREPGIDEHKTLWNAQPGPFVPVFTFDPDPELAQQGSVGAGGTPTSGAPAQPAGPAQGRKRVRVVAAAGLLAAVAGIAVGVKFLPSTGGRSPITPIPSAPSMAASPVAARPDATPATVPVAPVTSSSAPARASQDMPGPRTQAKERRSTSRSVAAATREGQRRRQSATAARGDICKNAVVSERPASCLFKKQ